MTTLAKLGLALGLVAVSACSRSGDRTASDPTPVAHDPAMQPASRPASAAESIAEARCAREQRCDNVGSNKKYSSHNDCMARIRDDWKADLNARECHGGINQTELNECLGAIRGEECSSPFDTLDRVTQCSAASICIEDADDKR